MVNNGLTDLLNTALQTILDALPNVSDSEYQAWLAANALDDVGRRRIGGLIRSTGAASIDILIAAPVVGAEIWQTFESLANQLWPSFAVVLAAPPDQMPAVERLLANFSGLRCTSVSVAGPMDGVAAIERAALAASRADFIGFLAPGDALAEQAVAEVVLALGRRPETLIIMTDEDWIDSHGVRSRPRLKAGWDPDAQFAFDLFGRFSPMHRETAIAAGGLRSAEGLAAHYGLHCRVAGEAEHGRILHLPSVLRHARKQPAASSTLAEAYASAARTVAREQALEQEGAEVEVMSAPLAPYFNRLIWPVPNPAPLVSVLIPTRDRPDLLSVAIKGVLEQTDYPHIEVLVMDNGSVEAETFALFERILQDTRVKVLNMPGPFNYSRLNNRAAAVACGEILLLLNNDVEIMGSDWLRELVSLAVRDEIGCVGAKLIYSDGRIQHAGINMAPHTGCAHVGRLFPRDAPGDGGLIAVTRTHSAVTAACLAIRADVFAEVGGLDEVALTIGYNDVDLCLKVRDHGYRSVCNPNAVLWHFESVSRGHNDNPEKQARERRENGRVSGRWHEIFLDDPHQNPNSLLTWEGVPRLVASRRRKEWS